MCACVCVCVSLSLSLSISLVLFFLPSCFSFIFSDSCFLFLLCLHLCFKILFCFCFLFFCSLSCFVLNHDIWFVIALHLVFFLLFFVLFLLLWYFVISILATYQKHLSKFWKLQKSQKWKMQTKTDILTRAVSTSVLTNSVFFLSCVSLKKFAVFAESTINIGVSSKKQKHKINKNYCVKNWSKVVIKTGPSMLCNIVGPILNTRIGSFFVFALLFILFFLRGKQDFQKQKTTWTSF